METIRKRLEELKMPERNVRLHTEKQLQEYERSVRMFGQIRPIVIDEAGEILAGRGLYETLKRMGEEYADCYQYSGLSMNQKKKLMIADNKIFSLGVDNLETLNQFLVELEGDLEIPGFDEEILKQIVADADEVTEKISEYGILDEDDIQAIRGNAERMDQRQTQFQSQRPERAVEQEIPQSPAEESLYREKREEPELEGRYVTCPECGRRIWL